MRWFVPLLAVASACGSSAAERRAQSLYDQGDFQGAARSADADLASNPGDAGLHRIELRARLAGGDAQGAVDGYLAWRRGNVDDTIALRLLAETTLQQALRSPSTAVKVEAIGTIEDLEIESLADDVIQRMGDQDDQVQAAAAAAVLHAHPQAGEILANMLTSDDPIARAIAVRGMARKVGVHAADDLRNATRDPDARVRHEAIAGLAPLDDAATTDVLVGLAQGDPDDGVRAAALMALAHGARGDLHAVAHAALADKSLGVRIAAVDLVALSNDGATLHALLTDVDPIVAAHAARASAKADPAGAAAAIDRALADAQPETRAAALNLAAAAIGKDAAATRAQAALADQAISVRLAAARVLAAAGRTQPALDAFAAALATGEPDDKIEAAADLARLGDPRGVAALSDLTKTADSVPRRRAAVGAHLTARHITPGLVTALADAAPEVRVDAARTLWLLAHSSEQAEQHAED